MKKPAYSLSFTKVGKILKKGWQVYIKYYANDRGKRITAFIPTGIYLDNEDFDFLLQDTLGGKTYVQLQNILAEWKNVIDGYFREHKYFPTKDQLLKTTTDLPIQHYSNALLKEFSLKAKESSLAQYKSVMKLLLEYFETDSFFKNIDDLISKKAMDRLLEYYIGLKHSNDSIKTKWLFFSLLQNYIRREKGMDELVYKWNFENPVKKIHLEPVELDILIGIAPKNKGEQWVVDLIKINRTIGLRINELLDIRFSDIDIAKDYITIHIYDRKNSRQRPVIVKNDNGIEDILRKYWDMCRHLPDEERAESKPLHFRNDRAFNVNIKSLASRHTIFQKKTRSIRYSGKKVEETFVPKYTLLSSHAIRRFAVTANSKEYGILYGASLSGHRQLRTITKHYLGVMTAEDLKKIVERKIGG